MDTTHRVAALLKHLSPHVAAFMADGSSSASAAAPPPPQALEHAEHEACAGAGARDVEEGPRAQCMSCAERCRVPANAALTGAQRLALARRKIEIGPNGNMWMPFAVSAEVQNGYLNALTLFDDSICVFRTRGGRPGAIEDRCVHRQLRLSKGHVEGEHVACCYHGWEYDLRGRVVRINHEIPKSFKTLPDIEIRHWPVTERYGLVWVFGGDPALSSETPLPHIEPLEKNVSTFSSFDVEASFDLVLPALLQLLPVKDGNISKLTNEELQIDSNSHQSDGRSSITYRPPYVHIKVGTKHELVVFVFPLSSGSSRVIVATIGGAAAPGPLRKLLPSAKRSVLTEFRAVIATAEAAQKQRDQHGSPDTLDSDIHRAFNKILAAQWDAYQTSEKARRGALKQREWNVVYGAGLSSLGWAKFF